MQVWLNSVTGLDDAMTSMYMSKRTWTRELENKIRFSTEVCTDRKGGILQDFPFEKSDTLREMKDFFDKNLTALVKWGARHMTMLRFVMLSITVEGVHRAGQDDIDAHAMRYHNAIIRSSTRLAKFGENEMSDFYKDKIIPTDVALAYLGIQKPESISYEGVRYVKAPNGYVREDMKDNKDALRGLYMLSIPSNFIMKIQLTEWAHVYKERNESGTANPEVKQFCESVCDQLEQFVPQFNRELLMKIPN